MSYLHIIVTLKYTHAFPCHNTQLHNVRCQYGAELTQQHCFINCRHNLACASSASGTFLDSERPAGLESCCGTVCNPVRHLLSEAFNRCCLGEEACCYADCDCFPTLHTQQNCISVHQQDNTCAAVYVSALHLLGIGQGRAEQGRAGRGSCPTTDVTHPCEHVQAKLTYSCHRHTDARMNVPMHRPSQ